MIYPETEAIGRDAFRECNGIESITILNKECSISDSSGTLPSNALLSGFAIHQLKNTRCITKEHFKNIFANIPGIWER